MKDEFLAYYKEYSNLIINFINKMTGSYEVAEEIAQDVFIKFYDNFDKLNDDDHRKYWLFKVAKNASLNYIKKKKKEQTVYKKYYNENITEEKDDLVEKEIQDKVKDAIDKLPEKLKVPLLLKEYSDMNYKDIAKMLFTTEGNVKVMILRAKKQLFEILKEDMYDEKE